METRLVKIGEAEGEESTQAALCEAAEIGRASCRERV